jgi:hypothetical protein
MHTALSYLGGFILRSCTMGFFLSILYFVTYYLTPVKVFGPLAAAHLELILAALLLFVSIPSVAKSFILKTPQSLALIGLALAVFLSVLIGMHWPGGAITAFQDFIPNIFAYFMVCLHCNSKRKLQILVLMLLFVCVFAIAHGAIDLFHGIPQTAASQMSGSEWDMRHPYLLAMSNDTGERFYRLRGPGEISDPNDFAQLIVGLIPLIFIFWRPKKMFWNIAGVLLPVCVLLYGAFLTFSAPSGNQSQTSYICITPRRQSMPQYPPGWRACPESYPLGIAWWPRRAGWLWS